MDLVQTTNWFSCNSITEAKCQSCAGCSAAAAERAPGYKHVHLGVLNVNALTASVHHLHAYAAYRTPGSAQSEGSSTDEAQQSDISLTSWMCLNSDAVYNSDHEGGSVDWSELCVARWRGSWEFLPSSRRWSGLVSTEAPVDHLFSRWHRPRLSSWGQTSPPTGGCESEKLKSFVWMKPLKSTLCGSRHTYVSY